MNINKSFVVANWKMNMNLSDVDLWVKEFTKLTSQKRFVSTIIIAPSNLYLHKLLEVSAVVSASQDISLYDKGAHTGEAGAFQIKDFCKYSIIGHSERNEALDVVIKKRNLCLLNKILPIICFKDKNHVGDLNKDGCLLAWEDPENISVSGKYKPKDVHQIEAEIKDIKALASIPVLYGGSVNRQNAGKLANINGLDGVLVGNASLDPSHFYEIIQAFEK